MSWASAPDFFCREAQRLGYVARSAFKLLQMQKQFRLIRAGASVLDLGCAPGAWLQVACQSLGPVEKGGAVIGIDLKVSYVSVSAKLRKFDNSDRFYGSIIMDSEQKVKVPSQHCDKRVETISADVMSLRMDQARGFSPQGMGFSIILSDMCPAISGITTRDSALSCELGKRALSLAIGKVSGKTNAEEFLGSLDPDFNKKGILRPGGNIVIKLLESEDTEAISQDILMSWYSNIRLLFVLVIFPSVGYLGDPMICQILQGSIQKGVLAEAQGHEI
ncbi:AdoMet-dependent rRNA methyltransferase SPB1 [Apostasia shenzhenica]|uniref:rRNA methyltransferase 2, mitochondrial n=1 Tax=Apostasia shenzhenica TaxID=1088818 RepID=A0A2I0B5A3_9ASPA|nr:AdoMet-dependent rRNA methyltransferase SPB1 [Apostasia shenzhenica]